MTRVHRRELTKPDGRKLWLYADHPIEGELPAPAPEGDRPDGSAPPRGHLRWHPLRGEWVSYAAHRQTRTFLPPADFDPLAPTRDPSTPTEVPAGDWDVAVFENRFPTFRTTSAASPPPSSIVPTAPADGSCEVVVFAQESEGSLATLPPSRLELIVNVWAERTAELGRRDEIRYVMPFENRGVEVGVTLPHPHGQIYAYPFVPPIAATELSHERAHRERTGSGLLGDLLARELADGRRILVDAGSALAWIPAFARYAYEIWVAPKRDAATLDALREGERADFARALGSALRGLDALFEKAMPYVLVVHQAPTDGEPHPEAHVHAEIYPALRMPGRLKYLGGSELGAGAFTADTLPEEKAAELRAAIGASR